MQEQKELHPLFWFLISSGLMAMLSVAVAVYFWQKCSAQFAQVDHTSESFTVNSLSSAATPAGEGQMLQIRWESTDTNPKSGVTLKLSGNWSLLLADSIETPNRTHRYCVLASHTGLSAMSWPSFPEYLPSLKADVDYLRPRFTSNGFVLRAANEMLVNGRKALLLELVSTRRQS